MISVCEPPGLADQPPAMPPFCRALPNAAGQALMPWKHDGPRNVPAAGSGSQCVEDLEQSDERSPLVRAGQKRSPGCSLLVPARGCIEGCRAEPDRKILVFAQAQHWQLLLGYVPQAQAQALH